MGEQAEVLLCPTCDVEHGPRLPPGSNGTRRRLYNAPVIKRLFFRTAPCPDSDCWVWMGATNTRGYGHIRLDRDGPLMSVHRVVYDHWHGEVPPGLEVDHLCRVRNCVHPQHLEAVDHTTNIRRGLLNQNDGKTHCIHGHPFNEANTYIVPTTGYRSCRTCSRNRMREWRSKNG